MPIDRSPRHLDRSQLPNEFSPEAVRAMDMRTARLLARPGNGILTADEQRAFDAALREVLQGSTDRLDRSFGRDHRGGPVGLDPELRRSYQRTQRRLEAQAARARRAFPQLTDDWDVNRSDSSNTDGGLDATEAEDTTGPEAGADLPTVDRSDVTGKTDETDDAVGGDEVSLGELEDEITQSSDMLDILEQIAGIQQQQLEHQRSQLLSETRSVFFALAVSVAVIVAGVAPLVEASPHERRLVLLWTAVVCALAGGVYAAVRAFQSRSD